MSESIRLIGDPILTTKTEPVEAFDDELNDAIRECEKTFMDLGPNVAAAVAAPQIGFNKRVFVGSMGPIINPEIIEESEDQWKFSEGCLSIPGLWWYLDRPKTIRVNYQAPNGLHLSRVFSEFDARVFQHETDHLDGILLVDRLTKGEKKRALQKLRKKGFKV